MFGVQAIHTEKSQLEQAHDTQANIIKLVAKKSFRRMDWDALEGVWALDENEVCKQLEQEIETMLPTFDATKEKLEAVLA